MYTDVVFCFSIIWFGMNTFVYTALLLFVFLHSSDWSQFHVDIHIDSFQSRVDVFELKPYISFEYHHTRTSFGIIDILTCLLYYGLKFISQ